MRKLIITMMLLPCSVLAGQVGTTTTYQSGDTLTAAGLNGNFDAQTTAINDNDTRITNHEGNASAHHSRYTDAEAVTAVEGTHGAVGGGLNASTLDGLDSTDLVRTTGDLGVALTGLVSVLPGATAVNGTGTAFTTELAVGDAVSIGGEIHTVAAVTDDLNLTLTLSHTAGATDVAAYKDNALLSIKNGASVEKLNLDSAGNLNISGEFMRKIQRATALGPGDDLDSGKIASRVLTFTKLKDATAIRIGYSDNLRVMGLAGPNACRWEIRVDDLACPGGELIYDMFNQNSNAHTPASVFGYCEGVTAGLHQISVWVGPVPGGLPSDCYTGWSATRWTIEAEEVY